MADLQHHWEGLRVGASMPRLFRAGCSLVPAEQHRGWQQWQASSPAADAGGVAAGHSGAGVALDESGCLGLAAMDHVSRTLQHTPPWLKAYAAALRSRRLVRLTRPACCMLWLCAAVRCGATVAVI